MRIAQTQVVTAVDGWTGRGIATMPSGAPHWLRRFDVFGVLPIVAKTVFWCFFALGLGGNWRAKREQANRWPPSQ